MRSDAPGPVRSRGAARGLPAVVALAVAALLGLSACTGGGSATADRIQVFAAADRKAAPELTGELLDGSGTYDPATHAGAVLVFNCWGSCCGP
jgi:hypothetical protein